MVLNYIYNQSYRYHYSLLKNFQLPENFRPQGFTATRLAQAPRYRR